MILNRVTEFRLQCHMLLVQWFWKHGENGFQKIIQWFYFQNQFSKWFPKTSLVVLEAWTKWFPQFFSYRLLFTIIHFKNSVASCSWKLASEGMFSFTLVLAAKKKKNRKKKSLYFKILLPVFLSISWCCNLITILWNMFFNIHFIFIITKFCIMCTVLLQIYGLYIQYYYITSYYDNCI